MSTSHRENQTLSQRRAEFALRRVREVVGESFQGEFRSHAAGLPPMIQMNGFGQALAFCRSKTKLESYQRLYQIVSEWLIGKDQPYEGHEDVMDGITEEPVSTYRLAQNEALALLDWVKRFATAFIEDPKDGDGDEDEDEDAPEDAATKTESPDPS